MKRFLGSVLDIYVMENNNFHLQLFHIFCRVQGKAQLDVQNWRKALEPDALHMRSESKVRSKQALKRDCQPSELFACHVILHHRHCHP